jgi:F-type H+-transporting ATPase subunit delta
MNVTKKVRRGARRLLRLCLVNGRLDDDRVRETAGRIAASGRRGALGMLTYFQRLVRLDQERHLVIVESAAPLDIGIREGLAAGVARRYGPGLKTAFADNPALIGGLRIKVGSDVYDGSLRTRLAALAARL